MTEMMIAPDFIQALFAPKAPKSVDKKTWGISVNTVFVPLFTASNADGLTAISNEAIGAPYRIARDTDGTPKLSASGKPIIRLNKDFAEQVGLQRENYVAQAMTYVAKVAKSKANAYATEVAHNREAGTPIVEHDNAVIYAYNAQVIAKSTAQREIVKV